MACRPNEQGKCGLPSSVVLASQSRPSPKSTLACRGRGHHDSNISLPASVVLASQSRPSPKSTLACRGRGHHDSNISQPCLAVLVANACSLYHVQVIKLTEDIRKVRGKVWSWPASCLFAAAHLHSFHAVPFQVYTFDRVLGKGQFGTTRLAIHKETKEQVRCHASILPASSNHPPCARPNTICPSTLELLHKQQSCNCNVTLGGVQVNQQEETGQ